MSRLPRFRARRAFALAAAPLALAVVGGVLAAPRQDAGIVVFAQNDLGMHCMNEDFSELVILPPFNTLRAQVLRRKSSPEPIGENVTVTYRIPTNTESTSKTNFWSYAQDLFGVALPPDVGLTGNGLRGEFDLTPGDPKVFEATGIPLTPTADSGRPDPYPLARIVATTTGGDVAETPVVVPVSTEISCNLCHDTPGISTATDILRKHDVAHGTDLENQKPVLCADCHADPALGLPGQPGVPHLSAVMHGKHAGIVEQLPLQNSCYACHPGIRTQCQRDVHLGKGIQCVDCHGGMAAMGDPTRAPWADEPRCGDCHQKNGFEFEEPGKLFKDSVGHGNVMCSACHGSPHAITPTLTDVDNLAAIQKQGHAGVIDTCTVCHTSQPSDPFPHRRDND